MGDPDAVKEGAKRYLGSRLGQLGAVEAGTIRAGTAYGVRLDVLYWLVGPIDHLGR